MNTTLNNSDVDLTDVRELLVSNPAMEGYKGTETEMLVLSLIKEGFADIKGSYGIHIQNPGNVSVDELTENHLIISYQLENNMPFYIYQNGEITIY